VKSKTNLLNQKNHDCPLCFSLSNFFQEGDDREYYLCPCCAMIFVPSKYFLSREEETERYLEHENSLDNEGYVAMFENAIDHIKNSCSNVHLVLDYGCGYEPVLKTLLERHGYIADIYDENFFPELDLQKNYDLIISTETFEHFKYPGKELDRLISLLSPTGYLAVMTQFYSFKNKTTSKELFKGWYYKRDPTHIVFYSDQTFDWVAKHYGLKTIFNNNKNIVILQK
jgi:hypothetical protein